MRAPFILVVDDDPDMLEFAQSVLEEAGFLVLTATHGARALGLLEVTAPSLPAVIVTDMMMPVMDGLALLRELGERKMAAPIIAMSGFGMYLEEAQKLGAAVTLQKPIARDELVGAVERLAVGEPVSTSRPQAAATATAANLEARRIQAIADLHLDEVAPEAALHTFVDSIARAFDVPMCFISVIDESRQFWTAGCGIPDELAAARGSPREEAFCSHAVVAKAALVVQDAAENPYFRDNPFVTLRGVRFYAGVPLIDRRGDTLGTLCLLDYHPRVFTYFDLELLSVLARRVLAELELRERRRGVTTAPTEPELAGYADPDSGLLGREALIDVLTAEMWRAGQRSRPIALVGVDASPPTWRDVADALARSFDHGWVARIGAARIAIVAPGTTPGAARAQAREAAGAGVRIEALDASRYLGAVRIALRDLDAALA
jgi:CheY-like chemotaxis protein